MILGFFKKTDNLLPRYNIEGAETNKEKKRQKQKKLFLIAMTS